MSTIEDKIRLWTNSNKGIKSQFTDNVFAPVTQRVDISTSIADQKIERGDIVQRIRLRRYPSINVNFDRVYAGSINSTLDDAKDMLMEAGFRNGPLAYVEVADEFGPDDGSYWLHIITETGQYPIIENRLGLFRRIKDQIHVVTWVDEEREMVHFGAHREQSAPLQPARHAIVNKSNADRGIRDFRNKWSDEFDEELLTPLE